MDESIDRKRIQANVKEQLLGQRGGKEADDDDLEMTVEKVEEETDENYEHEGTEDYDPTLDLSNYQFPSIDLLDDHTSGNAEVSNDELISNKNKIVETLRHYKIEITKIRATIGPTITLSGLKIVSSLSFSSITFRMLSSGSTSCCFLT